MAKAGIGAKRRWLASAIGAAAAMAGLLLLFRIPATQQETAERQNAGAPVRLSPRRSDELAIRDPAPLFLPTRFNAEPVDLAPPKPGARFLDEDAAQLNFAENAPQLHLPIAIPAPHKPSETLGDVPGTLALGLGETMASVRPVEPHAASLQVFATTTGASVLGATLGVDARPPDSAAENKSWHPLEFLAAVDAAGLVGPPVLTSSSGLEDVDNFFRSYLAERFHLGERLTPGFYRIVIGP